MQQETIPGITDAALPFLSQSEGNDAFDCPQKWWARWRLKLRPQDNEGPPRRIGTLMHAFAAELAVNGERDIICIDVRGIAADTASRRGWDIPDDLFASEVEQAAHAAGLLWDAVGHQVHPVHHNGVPMVEQRVRATWADLERTCKLLVPAVVKRHYAGIEGAMDLVTVDPDGEIAVVDWKARMKAGAVSSVPESGANPNTQGAYYTTLCRALGINARRFRQVQVYAGRWLATMDYLEAALHTLRTGQASPLVCKDGMPRLVIPEGTACTGAAWAEAWRQLAEDKRLRSMTATTPTGRPKKPYDPVPDMLEAKAFAAGLDRIPRVTVREFRMDPLVCAEVVSGMLRHVGALLAQVEAGEHPARNLRDYATAPCVKPGGCAYQGPCLASLGSNNVMQELMHAANAARVSLPIAIEEDDL